MQFLNEPVDVNGLPKAEEVILKPIEKDYLRVLRLEWLITSAILSGIAVILIYLIPSLQFWSGIIMITASWLFVTVIFYIGQTISFKIKAYAVRERDIIYRNGWIIHQTHICPFNRIQNSSVSTGPLERKYKLATLVLYTAGTSGADLHIRGLKEADAHSIKDWITKRLAMKNNLQHDWYTPQRQSWAGLMIILYKSTVTIIKSVWPLLVILLFRESKRNFSTTHLFIIIIAALIFISSLIDFFYFRFYISNNELIIRKGFIRKKVITIPLNNVHAVHIEQSWMHQLLNVAKVKIDTAGSEKTEAAIDAIAILKAEMLKAFLVQKADASSADKILTRQTEQSIIKLSFTDVLKLGITSNHIQTFFIILAFCLSMYQNLQEIFGKMVIEVLEKSSSSISLTINAFLILGLLILIISIVVSLIRIALAYFDFNLSETAQGFKIKAGLTSIKQNLVPFSKIQYISWNANWIRRKIGLFILELHQANNEDARRRQKVTIPIMHQHHIGNLLTHYHPDIVASADSIHKIHDSYPFRRMLLTAIPPGILLTIILIPFFNLYAFLFLLIIPYVFINSWIFKKNFRLFIAPEAMRIYSGVWGRENKMLQWYKVQKITLQQSPYQRRNHLASIKIFTAGGIIKIPYIHLNLARYLQNYTVYKIESSDKSWM